MVRKGNKEEEMKASKRPVCLFAHLEKERKEGSREARRSKVEEAKVMMTMMTKETVKERCRESRGSEIKMTLHKVPSLASADDDLETKSEDERLNNKSKTIDESFEEDFDLLAEDKVDDPSNARTVGDDSKEVFSEDEGVFTSENEDDVTPTNSELETAPKENPPCPDEDRAQKKLLTPSPRTPLRTPLRPSLRTPQNRSAPPALLSSPSLRTPQRPSHMWRRVALSGGRRRQTITRPGFFADPTWDASPSLSIEDDLDQTSSSLSTEDDQDQEEAQRSAVIESGDVHINATLSSLREAVKNGLLKDAFREREKDEEDVSTIETSEAHTIAHNPSDVFGPRKMFRKAWEDLIATSTSPMDRKLVGNLSLV